MFLTCLINPNKHVSWQVLSELLADLDACDLQKSDAKVLANGEVAPGQSHSEAISMKAVTRLIDWLIRFEPSMLFVVSHKAQGVNGPSVSLSDKRSAIKNRIKQMMDVSRVRCRMRLLNKL